MNLALQEAKKAITLGEVPVGAVLVLKGDVIARAHNLVEQENDPTAHAEMVVIREGSRKLGTPRLPECDLYVTLEPCPMCAQALSFARIRQVIFGAYDPKGGGIDHGPHIYAHKTAMHKPAVIGGIEETKCKELLKTFFQSLRVP
ncbi:nucleoside deaminase [Candidatus Bealeia paramacronuclearis]